MVVRRYASSRDLGDLMGTQEGLRVIATLIGGGFLIYAAIVVSTGTLYDVDDGRSTGLRGQSLSGCWCSVWPSWGWPS